VAKEWSYVATLNSETRAGWNLGFQNINCHYSTVIALGISNESCTETQSKTATSVQLPFSTWKCLVSHMFL